MGEDEGRLRTVLASLWLPVRYGGRAAGTLVAVGLLLAVPVVLVATLACLWFVPLLVVSRFVELPILLSTRVLPLPGVPAVVGGVPLLYPLGLGGLTALVLGWPNPDYSGEFDPPILGP